MARTKQTARLLEGLFEPFFLICPLFCFCVGMAFIKRAVLCADSGPAPEGEVGGSQPSQQQQQSSESLSAVSADVSELMAPEKRKTLLFEPSVVSQSMIDFYVTKGYFAEGVCRPPGAELIPVPETGEVMVFKDFFYS